MPAALISWDERAWCFLCPRQVQDGDPGDRGIGHLTARVANFPGRTIVGAEKSTPFPSVVAKDQGWSPDGPPVDCPFEGHLGPVPLPSWDARSVGEKTRKPVHEVFYVI